jgi:hypothetical protein
MGVDDALFCPALAVVADVVETVHTEEERRLPLR